MAHNAVEGRGAARRTRPSEDVAYQTDSSENNTQSQIVQRLSRRHGISVEVAALVAKLSGLGPREVRP